MVAMRCSRSRSLSIITVVRIRARKLRLVERAHQILDLLGSHRNSEQCSHLQHGTTRKRAKPVSHRHCTVQLQYRTRMRSQGIASNLTITAARDELALMPAYMRERTEAVYLWLEDELSVVEWLGDAEAHRRAYRKYSR
jgi:hypothetical protein